MFIGKIEGQNFGINMNAINRSASRDIGRVQGQDQQGTLRDRLTLSPKGKKHSMIEQLMKQKELIQENKRAALDNAAENGTGNIQQQLDEYDQQLKEIDEQIAQIQTEEIEKDAKTNEDNDSSIYEKPKTEEELRLEQMNTITSLSSASDQALIISSEQDKLESRVHVLEAEIKTGNGNIEKKLEEVAELGKRAQQLTPEIAGKLEEANELISKPNDAGVSLEGEKNISDAEQSIGTVLEKSNKEMESSNNLVKPEKNTSVVIEETAEKNIMGC